MNNPLEAQFSTTEFQQLIVGKWLSSVLKDEK
jgi:hypothetical protein